MREYILKDGGAIFRREVTETQVQPGPNFTRDLAGSMSLKVKSVMRLPGENFPLDVVVKGSVAYWSLRLQHLTLRAPFKDIGGIMVPVFNSTSDPTMDMKWDVPGTMDLRLLFEAVTAENGTAKIHYVWLFAFFRAKLFRLPLANLYDDCRVCTGTNNELANTPHYELIFQELERFRSSRWNNDLWNDVTNTQKMFRFKPHEKGFTTEKYQSDRWYDLCNETTNAATQFII